MKNYKWIKDFSLELINQRSIAGREIPPEYNNQADYLQRIPKLVNMAANEIATAVKPIHASTIVEPEDGEAYGKYIRFEWPIEAHKIHTGGFLIPDDGSILYDYIIQENTHKVLVEASKLRGRSFELEYYRYPRELPDNPSDNTLLDTGLEDNCWEAAAFYVASYLVMMDDHFMYASLSNQYENRIARLGTPDIGTEAHVADDRFSMGNVYDVY